MIYVFLLGLIVGSLVGVNVCWCILYKNRYRNIPDSALKFMYTEGRYSDKSFESAKETLYHIVKQG